MLARHPATNFAMAKSNMATVGHDENSTFIILGGIHICNTTPMTKCDMRNPFLMLVWPLKGHGQGHFVTPIIVGATLQPLAAETNIMPLFQPL